MAEPTGWVDQPNSGPLSYDLVLHLYETFIRSLLEYCTQFWSPHLWRDVIVTARVFK